MARHVPSSIDKLDPKVREEISRLRIDHGYTLDQIVDHLKKMDVDVKRASLGRHVKKLEDKVGSKIKELRVAAEAVRKTLDDGDDAKVGALNRELAHAVLMRTLTGQGDEGEDIEFSPEECKFIGQALQALATAEKSDTERVLKVRKETAVKAAAAVDKVIKSDAPGLSKETVAKIRQRILGVAG
jgi:hypothetical protein